MNCNRARIQKRNTEQEGEGWVWSMEEGEEHKCKTILTQQKRTKQTHNKTITKTKTKTNRGKSINKHPNSKRYKRLAQKSEAQIGDKMAHGPVVPFKMPF